MAEASVHSLYCTTLMHRAHLCWRTRFSITSHVVLTNARFCSPPFKASTTRAYRIGQQTARCLIRGSNLICATPRPFPRQQRREPDRGRSKHQSRCQLKASRSERGHLAATVKTQNFAQRKRKKTTFSFSRLSFPSDLSPTLCLPLLLHPLSPSPLIVLALARSYLLSLLFLSARFP